MLIKILFDDELIVRYLLTFDTEKLFSYTLMQYINDESYSG